MRERKDDAGRRRAKRRRGLSNFGPSLLPKNATILVAPSAGRCVDCWREMAAGINGQLDELAIGLISLLRPRARAGVKCDVTRVHLADGKVIFAN